MKLSNFFKALCTLDIIMEDNTRRIKELEESSIRTESSYDTVLLAFEKRIKKLEGDIEHLDHFTVELEQYTKILSGRISKLKGKENEKTDNPTG